MKKAFHFLGGIKCAILLIGTAAVAVAVGTLLESKTGSHKVAAAYAYSHPAFIILLSLFFVNILFSAMRRWPFKVRHIPFLVTHLGLLMIISGVMFKVMYGTQGVISIVEGSGSNELLLADSQSVRIEKKGVQKPLYFDLKKASLKNELKIEIASYFPHSIERLETWIKGNQGVISGLPPFPVLKWSPEDPIPVSGRVQMLKDQKWNLIALKVDEMISAAQAVYRQGLYPANGNLVFEYTPGIGIKHPCCKIENIAIPIDGIESLLNKQEIDLKHTPTIAFLQDRQGDTLVMAINQYGQISTRCFDANVLRSLAMYDEGFGGYAAAVTLSIFNEDRETKEQKIKIFLEDQLRKVDIKELPDPLRWLSAACEKKGCDFPKCFIEYLWVWNRQSGWLFPEKITDPLSFITVAPSIDWEGMETAGYWASYFFCQLEQLMNKGITAQEALSQSGWPLPSSGNNDEEILTNATCQILSLADRLPKAPETEPARLFSVFLRAYGIHLDHLIPPLEQIPFSKDDLNLECPLTVIRKPAPPLTKWEDNVPLATFRCKKESREETVSLCFDRSGSGLCWPILGGEYLVRFQPMVIDLPFHIRLRNAKKISYANSSQPFSYECDLLITRPGEKEPIEAFLSMNQVYETWDGTRIYLSGIAPSDETEVKRVHLIINRDPAKYLLTYPGGFIVSLGIILLFWFRPKSSIMRP